jgi:hypothetical protein
MRENYFHSFFSSLWAEYNITMYTTVIPVVFHSQAASPACTELETIVLDWLGESHPVNTTASSVWIKAPAAMSMTSALFSNFPQRIMAVLYCWALQDWADGLHRNVGTEVPLLLDCLTFVDGTDRLSRNVGTGLPLLLDCLTFVDGTDRLSPNVGMGLPLLLDCLTFVDGTDRLSRNAGK